MRDDCAFLPTQRNVFATVVEAITQIATGYTVRRSIQADPAEQCVMLVLR